MLGIEAIAIFLGVIFIWRSIFVKKGNIRFWQLAAIQPDAAFEWMDNRSGWTILYPDDPKVKELKKDPDLAGPFILIVPKLGGKVVIFANINLIDESEFIELFGGHKERTDFPWISWLTMLYPIVAMVKISNQGAPILPTLGFGFANLGYLLLVAGILAGGFRALGFSYRIPTLIAAVSIWIVGTMMSKL